MRIAIIGAHQVGKTTLAEELMEKLTGYTLETEPYLQLEASGYEFSSPPIGEDFLEQFNYSLKLVSKDEDNILFDRCIIDILAYLHAVEPEKNIQELFKTAEEAFTEIDLLVFMPVEEPDLIPKHQADMSELRDTVNELLNDWIWSFDIETIEVSGSVSNRVNQVLAKIR
ncbi:hypothetical protein GCM10007424_21500 [Flavobacterium suaedae]|uniref:NadR/Ttd14 AAA domain-containing protein n=1 Tax=Flavobacterium suaedae TaxID=1767027 RepID=A0ABQ1JXG4_9FLAO|nr:AAA family ATPase [Flavobacterium suaedae]GGB81097.1 hypothetical protein GCM10007424_21500 [Flavobacterium suaedae]